MFQPEIDEKELLQLPPSKPAVFIYEGRKTQEGSKNAFHLWKERHRDQREAGNRRVGPTNPATTLARSDGVSPIGNPLKDARDSERCPLCHSPDTEVFCTDKFREYWRCARCALVSVPKRFHLSLTAERAEYDLHENDTQDPGYRRFLSRVATPLMARLSPGARGLDFGCGPGPALALMLEEAGYPTETYDPFYANDPSKFEKHYDFITATEVVEHLSDPKFELQRLYSMLVPGGVLAIMTKRVTNKEAFASWHYKNDKTHIAFFSEASFSWLASQWSAHVEFVDSDVVFVTKPLH